MQVQRLAKAYGARTLFDDLSLRVSPGDRMAVVGPNGAGKTTLLRIMSGEIAPDEGEIGVPRGARVALHDQRPPLDRGHTLGEFVAEGLADVVAVERRLAELEERMASGDAAPETLSAYERAQADLERAGGYDWRSWRDRVLRGLGVDVDQLDRPLKGFSGGEITRASLARALVSRPDLLLLDEPTNHLDSDAMEWLERAVCDMATAVIVVSHDRWFLESVATSVLEIELGRARTWPMGYSAYRREKALAIDRQSAEAERRAAEIARLERFVARWSAGTRSRQATSRAKRLERLEPVRPPDRKRSIAFGFPAAERSGRIVVEAEGLRVDVPERTLLSDATFAVERGWRVAIVGPNGAGKTTLLETLLGRRPAAAGRVSLGHKVALAYFSQQGEDLAGERTVVEAVLDGSPLTSTQARTLLGRFLFTGQAAEARLETLSGGERNRVSLVRMIARGGNLLALDEPTNHLDIESREALEEAIGAFDGTVVLVTHDRALIDAVATHTLSIEDGGVVMRPGGYVALTEARARASTPDEPAATPRKQATRARGRRAEPRPSQHATRRIAKIEGRISALEREIAEIEGALAIPDIAGDRARLEEHAERHRELGEELAWLMREWESHAEAVEQST